MSLTVIIPTLNEATNIRSLIRAILRVNRDSRIIICDDGSTDKTRELVTNLKKAKLLDRSRAKVHGLTASVIDGIKLSGTNYCIVMDADFQHPPKKINEIYNLLEKGNDLVIGVRDKIPSNWPLNRKIISLIATFLAKLRLSISGKYTNDPLSGFFGFKTDLVKNIISERKFELEGYKVLFEILKYSPRKIKAATVGYAFSTRAEGFSKLRRKHMFCFLRSLFK